jgi:prolyl-tRNA editing enzyme YbaK/EbsC (Cys-tRNA(Pro) deacylase)
MLARVVEYLRTNDIPFRVESYPSPEPEPAVAHAVHPAGTINVESHVLLVDGRPAIACVPRGEGLNLAGLRNALNAELVEEGNLDDLPWFLEEEGSSIPPLGRLFGVPLFVDERVATSPALCFAAFSPTDFVEVNYNDLARLEQPRVGSLALAGELPPAEVHH